MELKEIPEKAGIRTQTFQLRPEFSCGLAFSNVFVWWPLDQIVLIFFLLQKFVIPKTEKPKPEKRKLVEEPIPLEFTPSFEARVNF